MKAGRAMKDRRLFHVKRRETRAARLRRFDSMYLEALGRCVHAARNARRWALVAQLTAAAMGNDA